MRPEFGLPNYEIFDMKACRITTLLGAGEREEEEDKKRGRREGGFACAVQPHREVRPESGLVGIVEHIQVNKK